MNFSYFDIATITPKEIEKGVRKLKPYREHVQNVFQNHDSAEPEYSLVHSQDPVLHDQIDTLRKRFKGIKHLVLVGIGGQSLGVEAVHAVLDTGTVSLHVLDTIEPHKLQQTLKTPSQVKNLKHLAVVISSKSGSTTEVLTNAGILLEALERQHGKRIYEQCLFIGTAGSDFIKSGQKLGAAVAHMPKVVGGRYSVGTEAGLLPLALLGHDTDAYIGGLLDATSDELESIVAENAVRVQHYITKNYSHYNFFAFEPRLYTLGAWYRQLFAESIGKATDRAGKPVTKGFLPSISTPVELHSIGQLYLSGFPGVYTDFVTFDDSTVDFKIPKKGIAKTYGRFESGEVATAIYGGVMGAYQEKQLPYRSTIFEESLPYSLGLFMGMRMLETMYIAELMNLNAFDQPNVELYKIKTREILGL